MFWSLQLHSLLHQVLREQKEIQSVFKHFCCFECQANKKRQVQKCWIYGRPTYMEKIKTNNPRSSGCTGKTWHTELLSCSCRSCQNIRIFYTVSVAHVPPGTLNQLWTDRAQWNSALPPFPWLLESCGRRREDPAALSIDPSHSTSTSVPIKGTLHWPLQQGFSFF